MVLMFISAALGFPLTVLALLHFKKILSSSSTPTSPFFSISGIHSFAKAPKLRSLPFLSSEEPLSMAHVPVPAPRVTCLSQHFCNESASSTTVLRCSIALFWFISWFFHSFLCFIFYPFSFCSYCGFYLYSEGACALLTEFCVCSIKY